MSYYYCYLILHSYLLYFLTLRALESPPPPPAASGSRPRIHHHSTPDLKSSHCGALPMPQRSASYPF
jgi:hypothetical protein